MDINYACIFFGTAIKYSFSDLKGHLKDVKKPLADKSPLVLSLDQQQDIFRNWMVDVIRKAIRAYQRPAYQRHHSRAGFVRRLQEAFDKPEIDLYDELQAIIREIPSQTKLFHSSSLKTLLETAQVTILTSSEINQRIEQANEIECLKMEHNNAFEIVNQVKQGNVEGIKPRGLPTNMKALVKNMKALVKLYQSIQLDQDKHELLLDIEKAMSFLLTLYIADKAKRFPNKAEEYITRLREASVLSKTDASRAIEHLKKYDPDLAKAFVITPIFNADEDEKDEDENAVDQYFNPASTLTIMPTVAHEVAKFVGREGFEHLRAGALESILCPLEDNNLEDNAMRQAGGASYQCFSAGTVTHFSNHRLADYQCPRFHSLDDQMPYFSALYDDNKEAYTVAVNNLRKQTNQFLLTLKEATPVLPKRPTAGQRLSI